MKTLQNSTSYTLLGPKIYTEQGILESGTMEIDSGFIKTLVAGSKSSTLPTQSFPSSWHLIPGFIDLHTHGVMGADTMDGTVESLSLMSQALVKEGVTSFAAATMTTEHSTIESALKAIHQTMNIQKEKGCEGGAELLGTYLEGPFISPKKAGAHDLRFIQSPSIDLLKRWMDISQNTIRLVTLAPELPESKNFIKYLVQHQMIASLAHSNANYAETQQAIEAGACHTTHLFNAMASLHHREPGIVGAALSDPRVTVELIADGIHVHPAIIQLVYQLKGPEKIILVTDSMRGKQLPDGQYELGGQTVIVKQGEARLPQGTLAGSMLGLDQAIKNMMEFTHCSLFEAIQMVSLNPAKQLGIFHRTGSIAVGKKADLVLLDEKFQVRMTWVKGQPVFEKQY